MFRKMDLSDLGKTEMFQQLKNLQGKKTSDSRKTLLIGAIILTGAVFAAMGLWLWKKSENQNWEEDSMDTADEGAWKKMVTTIRTKLSSKNGTFNDQPAEAVSEVNSTLPDDH